MAALLNPLVITGFDPQPDPPGRFAAPRLAVPGLDRTFVHPEPRSHLLMG